MLSAWGGQKRALEVELWTVMKHCVVLGVRRGPLWEQVLSPWALSPDFTSCLIRTPLHGLNKPRLLMRRWSDFSGRLFLLFLWILGFHTTSNNLWCFFFSSEYTSVSFFFNLLWQNTHKKNQFNCTVERNYLFTTLPLLLCILELFFFFYLEYGTTYSLKNTRAGKDAQSIWIWFPAPTLWPHIVTHSHP